MSLFTLVIALPLVDSTIALAEASGTEGDAEPTTVAVNLRIEVVSKTEMNEVEKIDLSPVTSMVFLGPNDILLLDKNHDLTEG